jgi:hypothetical protein
MSEQYILLILNNFFKSDKLSAISVLKVRDITLFSVIINIVSFCGFEYPIAEDLLDKISKFKNYFQAELICKSAKCCRKVGNLKTNRNGKKVIHIVNLSA